MNDILTELESRARTMIEHALKFPAMHAAHLETFHRILEWELNLIEHIHCGKETSYTYNILNRLYRKRFKDEPNALILWCRFVYHYEVDHGSYTEKTVPAEIYESYRTLPSNLDHPHFEEIMEFYRCWADEVLKQISLHSTSESKQETKQ